MRAGYVAVLVLAMIGPLGGLTPAVRAQNRAPRGGGAPETATRGAGAEKKRVTPANGIKTPGVQIAFSTLRTEMEWDASGADWVAVANAVFTPDAKGGLTRYDARGKEKKPGEAVSGIERPCGGVVSAFGSLWTGSCAKGEVARLDPRSYEVKARIATGMGPARFATAATTDSVWALTDTRGTLSRIDPQQNEVVAEFRVFADCGSLVFGETALWLACPNENKVLRVDPQTNVLDKAIEVSGAPEAIAIGEGSVWVLCGKDGKVERIDPKTNKISKSIETGAPAAGGSIAFGEGSLWVSTATFPLTRIDPTTEKVAQQFYGSGGGVVQAGMGSVWLAGRDAAKLLRFDPRRIAATLAE
jgi:DNA-binding beta-propeller fold protein YncE